METVQSLKSQEREYEEHKVKLQNILSLIVIIYKRPIAV